MTDTNDTTLKQTIAFPRDLHAAIKQLAESEDRSVNSMVIVLLKAAIADMGKQNNLLLEQLFKSKESLAVPITVPDVQPHIDMNNQSAPAPSALPHAAPPCSCPRTLQPAG